MKMKRKELEEVNNEFSDFSLSSPATKIRRLDAELPPIMEGVEEEEQSVNDERAIVVFNPMDNPLILSPSNYSVSPEIISKVKDRMRSSYVDSSDNEDQMQNGYRGTRDTSLAVIPWVPSQVSSPFQSEILQSGEPESMEAEEIEVGAASMEIEEDNSGIQSTQNNPLVGGGEGLHQWHQPHCLTPQLAPNTSTPIVWYR